MPSPAVQRRRPRAVISRRALLQADNASVAVSGTILDLSDLGAFVTASPETIAVVRPGAKVQLVFRTPDPTGYQHLLVQGIVRWVGVSPIHRVSGFGLEFDISVPAVARFVAGRASSR